MGSNWLVCPLTKLGLQKAPNLAKAKKNQICRKIRLSEIFNATCFGWCVFVLRPLLFLTSGEQLSHTIKHFWQQ